MTITEKILARESGAKIVSPGDNIWVNAGILLTHDVCGPGTIGIFHREFGKDAKVFDPEKVVILPDHYIYTADEKAHRNVDILRAFAKEQKLPYFYDPGTSRYCGVCHVALPELGHVRPGETIFGTDSHTCTHGALGLFSSGIGNTDAAFVMGTGKLLVKVPPTLRFRAGRENSRLPLRQGLILQIIGDISVDGATYCAMEFTGSAISSLSIVRAHARSATWRSSRRKNGIHRADQKTFDLRQRPHQEALLAALQRPDAKVVSERRYDVSKLEPVVAKPHLPDKRALARDCAT
jgi:3-isopropylmalate/(R)-2-methylmalate dehydratase large subunit